jgi:hypothetical protein
MEDFRLPELHFAGALMSRVSPLTPTKSGVSGKGLLPGLPGSTEPDHIPNNAYYNPHIDKGA